MNYKALASNVSMEELVMPRPLGVASIRVLEARDLIQTDSKFADIDPYIIVASGSGQRSVTVVRKGNNPVWQRKQG